MNLTKYKQWMKAATVEQKSTAAEKADTSLAHLYQLSTGFRRSESRRVSGNNHAHGS